MIKYLGVLFILGAAYLAAREYSLYGKRRVLEFGELLRFIKHVKNEIACFLAPKEEWLRDFSSESLSKLGFFEAMSESLSSGEAFLKIEERLALSEKDKELFEALFSSLGAAYREEELSRLEKKCAELELRYSELRESSEKNAKIFNTLTASLGIGTAILLI